MNNPIHILVAEDDNDISRLLCSIIKKNGYIPSRLTFCLIGSIRQTVPDPPKHPGLAFRSLKAHEQHGRHVTAELNGEKLMLVCRWKKSKKAVKLPTAVGRIAGSNMLNTF